MFPLKDFIAIIIIDMRIDLPVCTDVAFMTPIDFPLGVSISLELELEEVIKLKLF